MENIFVEFLPPWVEANMQPAFYDKESGTVLQQTARMYDRVNMLVRMFNKLSKETKTVVEDYIEQFDELHDYVHDYFDNLDVQEEINNKIDAMVESGDFADALEPYLSEYLDELRAFEKSNNWENIQYNTYRDNTAECDYYITTIPLDNPYGGKNIMRVGIADDDTTIDSVEKPTSFAYRHKSPAVLNGGIFLSNDPHPVAFGSVIKDGVILKNDPTAGTYYRDMLAIKEDGSMKSYPATVNPQVIINDGYVDAFVGFFVLIENGVPVDYSGYEASSLEAKPQNIICRKTNGDYLVLTCDGRTIYNKGLSIDDCMRILGDYDDIDFAFALDGGGSTGTILKGEKINRNIDNTGIDERKVATFLYLDSTASEMYFQSGKNHNEDKIEDAEKELKYRQLPYPESFFTGNLYNKDDPNIQTNKNIDQSTGEVIDYDNTGGTDQDLMLSDYIQVPSKIQMNVVNSGDWPIVYFYDSDKNYLGYHNYNDDHLFTVPAYCAYVRVAVRRYATFKFGLYLGGTYDATKFIPYISFRYDTLYYEPTAPATSVSVGYILKYTKIRVYALDDSSNQQVRDILIRPTETNVFTNFLRIQMSATNQAQLVTSRLTINQTTGNFTIDREYTLTLKDTPEITGATSGSGNKLRILKVEAYY